MRKYVFITLCFLAFASNGQEKGFVILSKDLADKIQAIRRNSMRLSIPLNQFKAIWCDECTSIEIPEKEIQNIVKVLKNFDQKVTVTIDGRYEERYSGQPFNENADVKKLISELEGVIDFYRKSEKVEVVNLNFEDSVSIANEIITLYKEYKNEEIELTDEQRKTLAATHVLLKKRQNGLFDMFLGLLLGSIIGGSSLFIILTKFRKPKNFENNQKDNDSGKDTNFNTGGYKPLAVSNVAAVSQQTDPEKVNAMERTIEELQNEIVKKDKIIKNLTELLREKKTEEKEVASMQETEPRVVELSVEPKSPIFYLSTPNANGSFRDNRAFSMNLSSHVYEFELIGTDKAVFNLIDNPVIVKEAINAPESFLKPVCEYDGGFNSNARSIMTIEKGKAELQDEKWILKSKAKIKLL